MNIWKDSLIKTPGGERGGIEMAYTLQMQDTMELREHHGIDIHESKARNLSELQTELESWGFIPRIIQVLKNGKHVVDIWDGEMQLFDNTIIN